VKGAGEIIDEIVGKFCEKVIRSLRSTANRAAEWELGKESSRGKMA
jgi:hypothetical protein